MLVTLVAMPPLMALARSHNVLAVPDARRLHEVPTPQIGGLAIVLGVSAGLLVTDASLLAQLPFLAGVVIVLVMGLLDDVRDLGPWCKLLAQAGAGALTLMLCVSLQLPILPPAFPEMFLIVPSLGLLLGMLLVINATNLSDGLDGLAAGLALLSCLALALLAFRVDAVAVLALLLPLMGGLFGFLRFNAHPAQVFMGDHGAYFTGFALAFCCLSLIGAGYPVFVLSLLLGVPLYDTMTVAIRRVLAGEHPLHADRNHLHYRLMDLGLSHDHAVFGAYLIHALFLALGLLCLGASFLQSVAVYLALVAGLEVFLRSYQPTKFIGWVTENSKDLRDALTVRPSSWSRVIPLLVVSGPCWVLLWHPPQTGDVALICGLVGSVGLLSLLVPQGWLEWSWLDRVLLYLLGTVAVWLAGFQDSLVTMFIAPFGGLLAFLILLQTLTSNRGFRFTALDGLVLLAMLFLYSSGGAQFGAYGFDLGWVILWFYAVELLILQQPVSQRMRGSAAGLLLLTALLSLGAGSVL